MIRLVFGHVTRFLSPKSSTVLHRAIDLGINFIDTADHNNGNNEELLAKALKGKRDQVVLASKFGNSRGQPWAKGRDVNASAEYVSVACEASLRRLKMETIDLYYLHRVDPQVPIEETIGAMVRLIEQGKIRHIGLSEAGPHTIRRANAVHPITALQSEYFSLDSRLRGRYDPGSQGSRHRFCFVLRTWPGLLRRRSEERV